MILPIFTVGCNYFYVKKKRCYTHVCTSSQLSVIDCIDSLKMEFSLKELVANSHFAHLVTLYCTLHTVKI